MLSRLASPCIGSRFPGVKLLVNSKLGPSPNAIAKRWSGHNAMYIEPSNFDWKYMKNAAHFWIVLTSIPIMVFHTIISIRANPELTEIPEGYEPRFWEYEEHPLTRFLCRYVFYPQDREEEMRMHELDRHTEMKLWQFTVLKTEKAMKFFNDHRYMYFNPGGMGDYMRRSRYQTERFLNLTRADPSMDLEDVYNGSEAIHKRKRAFEIPVEGYKPEGFDAPPAKNE